MTLGSIRPRRAREAILFGSLAVLAGCGADAITAPGAHEFEASRARGGTAWSPRADASAVLTWNELARSLVARRSVDPPMASRAYAMLSVAQHRALRAALDEVPDHGVGRGRRGAPSPSSAVASASARVLGALFPADLAEIGTHPAPTFDDGDAHAGSVIGGEIAERILAEAATDGSDLPWLGSAPSGPGIWFSSASPVAAPLRPSWASVRPWAMSSGDQVRPPPPPPFGSPAFDAALAEVRRVSDSRTPEQLRIARFWSDGAGTSGPPGHWNAIAADLLARDGVDASRAAHVLALLNVAMMDAGIACWDSKYAYWLLRPSQADPSITTPVGLPNFPSYVSGHATFSGAAGEVLGTHFPSRRGELRAMAEEAAMSRLYGGIHYRFDSDVGLDMGRRIGELVLMLDRQRREEW
jgi:hypothetical protein